MSFDEEWCSDNDLDDLQVNDEAMLYVQTRLTDGRLMEVEGGRPRTNARSPVDSAHDLPKRVSSTL